MGKENKGSQVSREGLEAFLATAPDELKGWASDALAAFDAQGSQGSGSTRKPITDDDPGDDAADLEDLLPDYEDSSPRKVREKTSSRLQRRTGVSKLNLVLVALLAAAVVIIVQLAGRPAEQPQTGMATQMQLPSGHPSIDPSMAASMAAQAPQLDTEREAELKSQIESNPSDIQSRMQLAAMYFESAMYEESAAMLQQILDLDANNIDAMLNLGAVKYKQGRFDESEQLLLKSAELNPSIPQPWYNLGFVYMSRTPADTVKATEAWTKVLELDPDSEMATEVKGHLSRISSASPQPSASSQTPSDPQPTPSSEG